MYINDYFSQNVISRYLFYYQIFFLIFASMINLKYMSYGDVGFQNKWVI